MGQFEIYDFLKKNKGKFFSVKELSEVFGIRENTICININKLSGCKGVEVRRSSFNNCGYISVGCRS